MENNDILNAPLWQKILAFVLVIFAAGWLLYSYVYKPKLQDLAHYQKTLLSVELELKSILGEDIIIKDGNSAQIRALEEELRRLQRKIPTEKEIPYLVGKFITEVGQGLNIAYNFIEPQNIVSEGKYSRLPLKVEFTTDLPSFYSYLSQLKNLPSTVRVDNLLLAKTAEDVLTVNMQLSAFVVPGKASKSRETSGQAPAYYKNPFLTKEESELKDEESEEGLVLQGFWTGKKTKAFINNNIVAVGDIIQGYKVVSIYNNKVVLTKAGKSYTLTLED